MARVVGALLIGVLIGAVIVGAVAMRGTGESVKAAGTWEVYSEDDALREDVEAFVAALDADCDIVTTNIVALLYYRCP